MAEDKLMTAKEAARLLAITTQTLYKMRKDGRIEAVRIGAGRNIRFRESDILNILAGTYQKENEGQAW